MELANDWYIGGDNGKGALILLSVSDRKICLAAGRDFESFLTPERCDELLQTYAVSYYSQDKYNEGTMRLYEAVLNDVMHRYELESVSLAINTDVISMTEASEGASSSDDGIGVAGVIGGILVIVFFLLIIWAGLWMMATVCRLIKLLSFRLSRKKNAKQMADTYAAFFKEHISPLKFLTLNQPLI